MQKLLCCSFFSLFFCFKVEFLNSTGRKTCLPSLEQEPLKVKRFCSSAAFFQNYHVRFDTEDALCTMNICSACLHWLETFFVLVLTLILHELLPSLFVF